MLFISLTVGSEVDCLSNFTFNERVALHEALKNKDEIAQSYLKCMNKQLNVKIKVEIIIWCILYIKIQIMKRNISNKTKEMEKTQSGKTIHEMLMFISQQRKKSLAEWTDCVFYLLEFPYVCKLLKSLFIQLYKAVKELDREKILSMKNSKHSNFGKHAQWIIIHLMT